MDRLLAKLPLSMAATAHPTVRHHYNPDDAHAIAQVHRNVYCDEYGFNADFVAEVERDVRYASTHGWPEAGAVWLLELERHVCGSLALTFEGQDDTGAFVGQVRWFALELEIRGSGLGRRLFEELLETAEDQGVDRLELYTFSELETAGHLYRSYGFSLVAERDRGGWRNDGRAVRYQRYAVAL